VIELLRLNYDRAVARHGLPAGGDPDGNGWAVQQLPARG
jgi:hypothetical protein